jgi:hypothetical protein
VREQLVARDAAVESRSIGAWPAQGRVRGLSRRDYDRSATGAITRNVEYYAPTRQPVRPRRLAYRDDETRRWAEVAAFLNRDGSRVAIIHRPGEVR